MSDQSAPEPTMEEILASIRRIISEDDAPQGAAQVEAAADDDDEDVLELTQTVDESRAAPHEEIAAPAPTPEPAPQPVIERPAPAPAPQAAAPEPQAPKLRAYVKVSPPTPAMPTPRDEPLLSPQAASAAASAFDQLSSAASAAPQRDGRTLEDLAREMLQPMLRKWLDDNLPRIVQAAVREEVERISRSRVS